MRLKTKITLIIALLVLAVVGVISSLYLATVTRQVIREANDRANVAGQRVFFEAKNALQDAFNQGQRPASNEPADLHQWVRSALDQNGALTSAIEAETSYSVLIYEVTIVDQDGTALISSDSSLPGGKPLPRPPFSRFVNSGFTQQLRQIVWGSPQAYELQFPFKLGPPGQEVPFETRVVLQTGLLREDIMPALSSIGWLALGSALISVLLAATVSNALLAPVERISAQLDRISRGEFDQKPLESADEFGQVSTKISQIGQQLRGVREIFSTLRENLDQILGGLEDGLLLFTRDGRAVMVSPAVENFLGLPADQVLGRTADDVFRPGHPLRAALNLVGNEFEPVAATEADVAASQAGLPPQRIGASVQLISEGGTRMGALVTLRDLESIERIGRQLQVSERLSALSRVTSGVAHEVKNPLNSMRLWLENLKEHLPPGDEVPREAVAVLDSEIDRLDSVVKRFLDFMRPQEIRLEETQLDQVLDEVTGIARPQMERAHVQLETHYSPLPPVRVDRALLKQALLNLIFNAIEAMPSGGKLTLGLERRGESAEIQVRDTGKGIAPEHRGRIFQLFFTTRPGGSGIGLASAYKVIQMHDGSIDFESLVGVGTTFRIELPLPRALEPAVTRLRVVNDALARNAS